VPRAMARGGVVVCAGIHVSDIPSFPYALLWGERCVRSVANLTRADGEVATSIVRYPLHEANRALDDLRVGRITGAAVLVPAMDGGG
jgi:alcohol dehydrogenase, propanol-preferring